MRVWLALIAAALAAATIASAADGGEAKAAELLAKSQELVDAGDHAGAMQALLQALELAPEQPSIHSHMGYLYEVEGEPLKALESYGRLLELRPDDDYGRERVTHLFYGGEFPRRLRLSLLQFSPTSFVTDQCLTRLDNGGEPLLRRIAYTTGVVFPETMKDGDGPISADIPSAGGQGVVGQARFNRVCYGYVAVPEGEDLRMAVMVYYPSTLLSESGHDYAGLAERIAHIILRAHCYSRGAYGLPQASDEQEAEVVRVWLCESGPTGAEQYQNDMFVYDIARNRTPEEWLREVMHEWGHYALPRMGRFEQPEPYASGVLGEALFLQLLADEAGIVVGEPWPSRKARTAIEGLWGDGEVALAKLLSETRERTLDRWLAEGPNSSLSAGLGSDAFDYLVGMLLWVEAAHGHEMLRSTLLKAPGESPADFYYGYRQAVKEAAGSGAITIDAGAYIPEESTLATAPREGAIRREEVTLAAGDRVRYPVYLLDGPASVRITPGLRETKLNLYIDALGPLPLEGGEPVSLGRREAGWHTLTLEAPEGCAPVKLTSLVVTTGESDVPTPGL